VKSSIRKTETWLEPSRALEIVLDSLGELVEYELAVVLEFSGPERLRVRRAFGPLATPRLSGYEISLEDRLDLATLLESSSPVLFDTGEGYRDTYAEVLDLQAGHSCLAVPLNVDGRKVGLLTLDHRRCGVFTPEILRFIDILSRLMALALLQSDASASFRERNARLIAERNHLLDPGSDVFRNLVGTSKAWVRILDSLRLVAATDSPVLLMGETGTGKEEAAKAIHRLSSRAGGSFVAVNCSALPAGLAESELFGHEKGSFTGAQGLHRGRFELADGGTLFLDEIGDLPMEIQPKLLRALQEGRIDRVGGEGSIPVDIRVIAATHADLGSAVDAGRFREDLFYRLAVFPVRLPPLAEREDDVLVLAERFLEELRGRPGWDGLRFDADALDILKARSWSGNVRELRNAVERAAILARGGAIGGTELAADAGSGCRRCSAGFETCSVPLAAAGNSGAGGIRFPGDSLAAVARDHIARTLEKTGGKIYGAGGAAELLGLKPSTLQSRMKKLGLDRKR